MPVTSSRMAAATTERRSRPCTARSIPLATAKSSHTTQTTMAVGERNVWTVPSPGLRPRLRALAAGWPGVVSPGRAPGGVLLGGEPPDEGLPGEGFPDGGLAAMMPRFPRWAAGKGAHLA